jgi:hypothetical protein
VGDNALPAAALIVLIVTAALTHFASQNFRQICDPQDTAPARLALFHSNIGTGPTDEFTPVTADNDALDPTDAPPPPAPPYWFADRPDGPIPHETPHAVQLVPTHFDLTAQHAEFLILFQRDYPAWRITRNGSVIAHPVLRDDGLTVIPLPAGPSTIEIRYIRLPDQTLGDALTLLALALFLFSCRTRAETS